MAPCIIFTRCGRMPDVTILGAGVAGLWAARTCLAHGMDVRLIDRAGGPGAQGCSWWAGGMLAPDCEGAVADPRVVAHGRAAADRWRDVTPVTTEGTLVLAPARDRGELARFARRTGRHRWLSRAGLAALEPDLAVTHGQALFFAGEAHLDPRAALADLAADLRARGVVVECAAAVPEMFRGPVLDCRGLAANGEVSGLRGVRGEMVVLQTEDIRLARPVRLLHPRHPLYIVPRAGGVFMLGATQIETEARGMITARAVLELLSVAYALDPRFAEARVIETGADLRPAFEDNVPRVVARDGVLHLNGLFRHGYLMAPVLAEQAVAYLTTGQKGDLVHAN